MTPRDIIASEILEVAMVVEMSTCVTDIYQRAGTDFCSVKRWQLLTLGAQATAKQTIKAGFLEPILPSQMAWLLEKFVSRTHIVVVTGWTLRSEIVEISTSTNWNPHQLVIFVIVPNTSNVLLKIFQNIRKHHNWRRILANCKRISFKVDPHTSWNIAWTQVVSIYLSNEDPRLCDCYFP